MDGVQPTFGWCILPVLFSFLLESFKKRTVCHPPIYNLAKKTEKCSEHQNSKYHQEAFQILDDFVSSMEKPGANVRTLIDKQKAANVRRNREMVKAVTETVLYCGRQCIALRGPVVCGLMDLMERKILEIF